MKFCSQCENMYYLKIKEEDDNQLTYYCRNCGHIDETPEENASSLCVINSHTTNSFQTYNYTVNQYTKHDPTLPRMYNMECPNATCKTNIVKTNGDKTPAEIIYMRYDDDNLKYSYICVECNTVWTQ